MDVVVETPHGRKTFAGVAPEKSAQQSFATRAASIPAGEVTVTATGDTGSGPITTQIVTGYEAVDCG
ncbi:hypothetical protein D3C79_1087890 [compost metagenome]